MIKTTIKIDGMMCGMCESHMNDAIRAGLPVKSVKASHKDKEAIAISENELDEEKVKEIIAKTGYTYLGMSQEPYEKKGLFGFLKK